MGCICKYLPRDQVRAALLKVPFKHGQSLNLLTASGAEVRKLRFVMPGCEGLLSLIRVDLLNSLGNGVAGIELLKGNDLARVPAATQQRVLSWAVQQ